MHDGGMRDHLDIADLTLVANNVVDVVLTTDASFSTTFVSPSAEPVLGCPPESARGSRFPDSVHPDDRSRLDALVASAEAAGASNSIEIRVRHHRTGEYLWFDISARRILDPEGRLASHVLVLRDAGGRKQAESALVESEARYREVIDAAHEVIFQTDLRGHWRLLSPSWTVLTEYAVEESLGRSALELVHPDDRAALGAIARELLQSGKAGIQRSTRILTKRGRARWVELSVSLSRGASRVLTGTAGTIRDVTTGHIRSCLNDVARALDRDILEGGKVDTIFQPVCDGLAASMKYPAVGIALRRKDGSVPLVGRAGHALAALDGLTGAWAASPSDRGPCAEAMRTRQTQRLALATGTTPGWVASGLGDGILQVAVMPLVTPNSVLGVLSVAVDDAESLDDDHVSALEALADRLSLALHLANHQTLLALQGAAMASSSSALFITDASGRIEWVNPAFEQMSGYTHDEAIGKSPGILRSDLQPKEVFSNMWSSLRAGRHWRGEIVNRRKSGETYVVSQSVTPLMDEDGSVSHLVAAHEDVTAHKEAETLIEHMAHHDSLTDLPNRAVLVERLQIALVRAERERERLAVLFVDLDRFKLVNDTLGHLVGDQLLREVAARLKSCVRDRDLVARLGGDEFTVLLPSCDTEIATWVAERILTSLRAPVQVGAQDVSITASIGIAFSSPETRR